MLEDSKLIIPANGIYIEGLNRKVYTVDNWQRSYGANSIVVASSKAKFRIALTEAPSTMQISSNYAAPLENYMERLSETSAKADYDGAGNTAKMLKIVEEITPELEECAGGAGTNFGTGGMITKLTAGKTANNSGVDMVLANGENPSILLDIIEGKDIGTLFVGKK